MTKREEQTPMESTPLFAIILLETVDFRNSLFWG